MGHPECIFKVYFYKISADNCRTANKHLLNLKNDEETKDVEGWDINIAFGKFMGPSEPFWEQCLGQKGKWYGYSPNVVGDEAFIRTRLYGSGIVKAKFGNCGTKQGDIFSSNLLIYTISSINAVSNSSINLWGHP